MKKMIRLCASFSALVLALLLATVFSACSSDADSGSGGGLGGGIITETESVTTTGSVEAATKNSSGQKIATLAATNGSYKFTETLSSTSKNIISSMNVDAAKSGTWQFIENGNAKYTGTYFGDISKFGSDAVKLILTVEKVLNNGTQTAVLIRRGFYFKAEKTSFSAKIPSVKTKSTSSATSTSAINLPQSVGENPLKGKTFPESGGDNITWTFYDSVAIETRDTSQGISIMNYYYSYDATKNLLYLDLKSELASNDSTDEFFTFSSGSEYVTYVKEVYAEELSSMPQEEVANGLENALISMDKLFTRMPVYEYKIDGDKITRYGYFLGTLPTDAHFYSEVKTTDDGNEPSISLAESKGGFWILPKGYTGDSDSYICWDPTYTDSTISGKLGHNDNVIGNFSAKYTTSGEGSTGTITITFTSLPQEVIEATGITTNTQYILRQWTALNNNNNN